MALALSPCILFMPDPLNGLIDLTPPSWNIWMSQQITVRGHRFTRGPDAWTSTIDIGGPGTPMAMTTVDFSIIHVDD
ncbi:MAG: hypothetical protein EA424_04070 [Planctomycetaceae bacterium]|nr:MAG: hypothetical protein EA424_04070 [Planctomycetaceae bacterium]